MKLILILSLFLTTNVFASEHSYRDIQKDWDVINYKMDDSKKEEAFKALIEKAILIEKEKPNSAEVKIWEAIVRASYAGSLGGLSSMVNALPQMDKAKVLLEKAGKIDKEVLEGAYYTTLGSFYYMVPGGILSWGDKIKAKKLLQTAVKKYPNNIDSNYYMGGYYIEIGESKKAIPFLKKAIHSKKIKGRNVFYKGRKAEARELLMQANETGFFD